MKNTYHHVQDRHQGFSMGEKLARRSMEVLVSMLGEIPPVQLNNNYNNFLLLPNDLWILVCEYEDRLGPRVAIYAEMLIENSDHLIGVPDNFDFEEYILDKLWQKSSTIVTPSSSFSNINHEISNQMIEDHALSLLERVFPGWFLHRDTENEDSISDTAIE